MALLFRPTYLSALVEIETPITSGYSRFVEQIAIIFIEMCDVLKITRMPSFKFSPRKFSISLPLQYHALL